MNTMKSVCQCEIPSGTIAVSANRTQCINGGAAPSDRPKQFAAAVQKQVNGALLKCEERFPGTGHHSVLYVVVQDNRTDVQQQVGELHEQFFGAENQDPLSPVLLELVDRRTDETLQRLLEEGLLRVASRTSRTLWPVKGGEASSRPLSSSEMQKAAAHRRHAVHKLKVADVLISAELFDEARPQLLEAMLAIARTYGVEQRLPEPENVYEGLLPPFSSCWGQHLPLLRRFAADPEDSAGEVFTVLRGLL